MKNYIIAILTALVLNILFGLLNKYVLTPEWQIVGFLRGWWCCTFYCYILEYFEKEKEYLEQK